MDIVSSSSSSAREGEKEVGGRESALQALQRLEQVDEDIMHIMKLAQDTVTELENIPHADFTKLEHLSQAYFEKCESVRDDMKRSMSHMQPYSPHGQGNYGLRKEVELAEALKTLDKALEK